MATMMVDKSYANKLEDAVEAYRRGSYSNEAEQFLALTKDGDAVSQFLLGYMHATGQGVVQNYTEAAKWYRLAAEEGDADAQYKLGVLYERGLAVAQDLAEAINWYRFAANNGHPEAQKKLDLFYLSLDGGIYKL